MRFVTVIAVLAGLASAMPEPVAEPAVAEAETLVSVFELTYCSIMVLSFY
jgi:hypothetical protein